MGLGLKAGAGLAVGQFVDPSSIVITSPLAVANCGLWLDASDATTINAGSPANNDPVSTWADKSGNGYNATQNGVLQIETATVSETVEGTLTAGNATVTVTAAGMTNSPKAVSVALATNDGSATAAGKMRTALAADVDVAAFFTVSGATTKIVLTALAAAANDATMNIATADGTCVGLVATPTSANTLAGRTAAQVRPLYKTNIQNGLAVVRFSPTSFAQHLVLSGTGLNLVRNISGVTAIAVAQTATGSGMLVCASDSTRGTNMRFGFEVNALSPNGLINAYGSNVDPADTAFGGSSPISPGYQVSLIEIDFVKPGLLTQSVTRGQSGTYAIGTTGTVPNTASAIACIGATINEATGSDTDICELIVYQRALTDRERRLVAEYLSTKWGTL